MKRANGTELVLTPGAAPRALVDGKLLPLSGRPLEPEETRKLCRSLFTERVSAVVKVLPPPGA
ncbi:MAG TPA: hypothetical protein VIU29_01005 [Candidatus Deferrimicrobiaceae bacterium]